MVDRIEYRKRPKIVCVDLDGCISSYRKGWLGIGTFGEPIPGAKEGLRKLNDLGYYVVVYTVRGDIEKIKVWLDRHGMVYDSVNWHPWKYPDEDGRKVGADVYVCDRSLTFRGDWVSTVREVKRFKTWEGI